MADGAPVDLDSLTKKQLAKQFKSVAKEIKSKDLEVKTNVLQKLKNHRYFFEGGCLPPFFESMTPKKKTLDMTKMTLESLLEFLQGGENGRRALVALRACTGGLASLEQLCACSAYHEVPKKPKKGQPPNPEDENAVNLRVLASNALFEIAKSLNAAPVDLHLVKLFSDIPNVIPNLCQALKCLLPVFENEESREGCLDQLSKVLYCLSSSMSAAHAEAMVASGAPAMLIAFLKEKKLAVYCLDIIYKLSLHPDGFVELSLNSESRQLYLEVLRSSAEDLVGAVGAGAADAPPAKDAKGGKPAKPAKGADPNAAAAEAEAKADENRSIVCQIKLLSAIYLNISTAETAALPLEEAEEVAKILLSVLLNTELWKLCNSYVPASRAPHVALDDTLSVICALLGSVAERDERCRDAVGALGGLDALGSALLRSRAVCDVTGDGASFLPANFDASAEDLSAKRIRIRKTAALFSLRRVAEKALLHLMTSPAAGQPAAGGGSAYQWLACSALAPSPLATSDAGKALVAKLAEAVVSPDEDLSNRIVRLLSGVLQCAAPAAAGGAEGGAAEGVGLCSSLGLDSAAIAAKISAFTAARASSLRRQVLAVLEAGAVGESVPASPRENSRAEALKLEAAAMGVSVEELLFFKWEAGERRGLRQPRQRDESAAGPENGAADESLAALHAEAQSETADFLFPFTDEALVHGLYLLDAAVPLSSEVVAAAGTKDLVESLVGVLYLCGPTSTCRRREHMTRLFDPRIYNWREEHDHRNEGQVGEFSMLATRGLAASVLTALAAADAKYRLFEGEVPCAPLTPAPASASAGHSAASLVCRLAADVCFSSLLSNSRLFFNDAGELMCGPATSANCNLGIASPSLARQEVLNSFLSLAGAIGSCGLAGLASCYESISSSDSSSAHYGTAAASLRACIEGGIAAGGVLAAEGEDASEALNAPFEWTFPLLFDYAAEGEAAKPTSMAQVLTRKDLWPFIAVAAALIGVVSDPRSCRATVQLAVSSLKHFSLVSVMGEVNQPAVADLFSAVFISLGGCTALVSSLSSFGALQSCAADVRSSLVSHLLFIVNRGTQRQSYWDKVLEDKLEAQRAAAAAAEAAGGKGKKDDKKGGKDDKKNDKGKKGAPVEEERKIEVPVEPDESHADPNHGPSAAAWASLLNGGSDCYICRTERSTPLTSLCQSMLSAEDADSAAVLAALLAAGVDVDALDGAGMSPLMYALALGNRPMVDALLEAGASTNVIDSHGVPTVVYAFVSIDAHALNTGLRELILSERRMMWADLDSRNSKAISCGGTCDLLIALLDKGVDLQVATLAEGNFPLHFACGYAQVPVSIGGVRFIVDNSEYSSNFGKLNTGALVGSLIEKGASAKACNKAGVLPVHIAAASGDVATIELLLTAGGGELANTADLEGFLPLHYAAAACPRHAFEVINALLKWGDLRPMGKASFQDSRTELTDEQKYWFDVEEAMARALSFGEASAEAVTAHRVSKKEIVRSLTNSGLSPLHLVLAGRALSSPALSRLMPPWDNVGIRVAVAEMFCELGGEDVLVASAETESSGLTPVHTLALLGVTPQKPNSFVGGSLGVICVAANNFEPPPTEQSQELFVKLQHGESELTTAPLTNSREDAEQLWSMPGSPRLDFSPGSDLSVSVWSGDFCLGRASVSVGTIARGQLLVGEEITMVVPVISETTAVSCGSVAVTLQTVNDIETTGVSGPIFSSQAFFSRILKSVDNSATMCSSACSWDLSSCLLPERWTPLHACILSQNRILATALIGIKMKADIEWTDVPYLHFVAKNCHNMTFCGVLIDAYARLKPATLNKSYGDVFPLHAAVRSRNAALVNALVDCPRVNLNAKDPATGTTAFLEACRTIKEIRQSDILSGFERNADRLDFFIADNSGETCIDYAVRNRAVDLTEALCAMRANDVVEKVTSVQGDSNEAVLLALENENLKLTKIVHASLFETKEPEPVAKRAGSGDDEEEGEFTVDAGDMFPGSTGSGPAVADGEAAPEEPAPVPAPAAASVEEASPLLEENERLLAVLLRCVLGSGVAPPAEFHAHECFAQGILLREHQAAAAALAAEQGVDVISAEIAAVSFNDNDDAQELLPSANQEETDGPESGQHEEINGEFVSAEIDQIKDTDASPITKELQSFNSDRNAAFRSPRNSDDAY